MLCKICSSPVSVLFTAEVMNRHETGYNYCSSCGFINAENPFWLNEAYETPINIEDTGLLKRNILFKRRTSVIIFFLFNRKGAFLDFAGGNGLFARMMRDSGFNFYWLDPYTENIFARGFEITDDKDIELITTFESFEHFEDPMKEISDMLKISKNILFSTEVYKGPPPRPEEWDYYSFSHGQHISFYSEKTLRYIAGKFNLNLCSNGKSFHLFTDKKISGSVYNLLLKFSAAGLGNAVSLFTGSKTADDARQLGHSKVSK